MLSRLAQRQSNQFGNQRVAPTGEEPRCAACNMRGEIGDDDSIYNDRDAGTDAGPPGGAAPSGPAPGGGSGAAPLAGATPVAVRNGPTHTPINTATSAGMAIAITLTSSTGVDADMATILDSEQVALSSGHTGSFVGLAPLPSSTSSFMAGYPIPDDRHSVPKSLIIDRADNHGGNGQLDFNQLDIWKPSAAGTAAAIPASGYRIRQIIKTGPGTKIALRTEKSPLACTVNGFTTTAGPSALQAEDNVVRT